MTSDPAAASQPRRARGPLLAALVVLLFVPAFGCGDLDRGRDAPADGGGPVEPPDDGGGDGEAARWETDVHPLLVDRCTLCHTSSFSAMPLVDDPEADFETVEPLVVSGDPAASRLLTKATGGAGHGGGEVLDPQADADAVEAISSWITAGAER